MDRMPKYQSVAILVMSVFSERALNRNRLLQIMEV